MSYVAPVAEQLSALETSANLAGLLGLPKYAVTTIDDVSAILTEAARFAADVFAPLNRIGDVEGAIWRDARRGSTVLGRAASWTSVGVDPAFMGSALYRPYVTRWERPAGRSTIST